MLTGTIFNLQRYCLHDGPGVRSTVFLKGCPARCWWCHNPESQSSLPEIACSPNRCIECDACLLACRDGLKGRDACTLCGSCTDACPTGAREVVGRSMTVKEVMTAILKDRMFFESSKGGVTFSGGEPLCQPQFLKSLLQECRRHEIHSAVDTAGLCPADTITDIAPLADLFLFDLKCADNARHREGTGIDNTTILQNLKLLSELQANIWIRIPVIPGFNDCQEEMRSIAGLVSGLPGVRQVWLLPYHATWTSKQGRLGKEAESRAHTAAPPQEVLQEFATIFRAIGIDTEIGGAGK